MSRKTLSRRNRKAHRGSNAVRFSVHEVSRLDRPLRLKCDACGAHGRYRVGTVLVSLPDSPHDMRGAMSDRIGFTGYFRCHKCDAGGPWVLPTDTLAQVAVMVQSALAGDDEVPIAFGMIATFDGQAFRYATQCEEHLKELIEREPDRAFLWVRLGNLYHQGEEGVLAETAYRKALELDERDIEAHAMLGQILVGSGRSSDAVPHWQAFLKHVRDAKHVKTELRRSLVRGVIDELLRAHAEAQGQIDLFPPADGADLFRAASASDGSSAGPSDDKTAIVEVRSFDLSTEAGFDELCDVFIEAPNRRRGGWIDKLRTRGRRRDLPVPLGAVAERHIGRNDPCACGSGRKYKKCCGRSE